MCHMNRALITDYFSSLQDIQPARKASITSRKSARCNKARVVPHLGSAYRPLSGTGTTRNKKLLRPKQEPVSPVMSGYGVRSLRAMSCFQIHLQLSVLLCRPRQLQLRHHRLPNCRTTIYAGSNQPVLCTVSVLPPTAISAHARLLCSTWACCHWGLSTASSWGKL
jgi:hypothetical protein